MKIPRSYPLGRSDHLMIIDKLRSIKHIAYRWRTSHLEPIANHIHIERTWYKACALEASVALCDESIMHISMIRGSAFLKVPGTFLESMWIRWEIYRRGDVGLRNSYHIWRNNALFLHIRRFDISNMWTKHQSRYLLNTSSHWLLAPIHPFDFESSSSHSPSF